jgi:superfamily I DNA and/or RNA helicase
LEAYLAEKVIREADVVCATLVGCDDRRLRGVSFDVAVVDEAAQALPPATLIAMRRAPRLVLCGDPHQLPPTVKSLKGKPLEETVLERLIAKFPAETVMLEVQHRMHTQIMSAGSAHFYGGRLKAHDAVANRSLEGLKPWLWVDTAGCGFEEERSEEGGSVNNREEARFVVERAAEWLAAHPGMSLGVVAPYSAQVELLRDLWRERVVSGEVATSSDVTIHTVDGFQGQERDGMIVSMTRSNDRGEVGFLSESRRIHVAQTRAKMACMLVGDSATLSTDPYLGWLLEHAQERDAYDSAWSWMV